MVTPLDVNVRGTAWSLIGPLLYISTLMGMPLLVLQINQTKGVVTSVTVQKSPDRRC